VFFTQVKGKAKGKGALPGPWARQRESAEGAYAEGFIGKGKDDGKGKGKDDGKGSGKDEIMDD
jgi:hypothetical protein